MREVREGRKGEGGGEVREGREVRVRVVGR